MLLNVVTEKLIKVAEIDQLPAGDRKLCTLADRRIALFNLDGTIYAIDNHCTHRDGPVGTGELKGGVITCPWHGWRFNVTTGRCLEGGANLRCYSVHVEGSDVFVDVSPPMRATATIESTAISFVTERWDTSVGLVPSPQFRAAAAIASS